MDFELPTPRMPQRHAPTSRFENAKEWLRIFVRKNQLWIEIAILGLIGVVLLQLSLLGGKAGYNARFGDLEVGGQNRQQVAKSLANYVKNATFTVKTQSKTYKQSYEDIGLHVSTAQLAKEAVEYPLWQRFIPFSGITRVWPRSYSLHASVDNEKLDDFVVTIKEQDKLAPTDAGISFTNGKVQPTPAKDGYRYNESESKALLAKQQIIPGAIVDIPPQIVKPEISDDDAKAVVDQAQHILASPPKIIAENLAITPEATDIAGWLTAKKNDKKDLQIGVDQAKLEAYLNGINKQVAVASSPVVVTLEDGGEVARTEGKSGRGINMTTATKSVTDAVLAANGAEVRLVLVDIAPKTVFNRTYTATQKGLQALLDDLVKTKGNYAISVQEIDGAGRSASAQGGKRFTAASTYKLWVAYYAIKEIEAGKLQWTDTLDNGKTVDECFEVMIVKSDNPCAETLGEKFGWSTVQNSLRSIGINNSGFDSAGSYATASDETAFLVKLMQGSLMKSENRDKLLSAMKRQVYRSGIPAGVSGATVADKVGFISGYLNDTAVVYGTSSTYVITILSSGSSWAQVADAASQIHNLLN